MPYIEVVDYDNSAGELRAIYDHLIKTRGKLAEVHKIQSLNPPTIGPHMDLYLEIMFGKSPLKRYQREMIGTVVSKANNCDYCVAHHAEALDHFWKDENQLNRFKADYRNADLNEMDVALCVFAESNTKTPSKDPEAVESLRSIGFDDRSILDATLVVAYFNYVNRIVLTLGLDTDVDEVSGYRYE